MVIFTYFSENADNMCHNLRNEFDCWNAHGNNHEYLGSLEKTLQETRSIHDSMNILKLNLLLILRFIIKI